MFLSTVECIYIFIWLKEYEENIDIARGYYGEKHKISHSLDHFMFKAEIKNYFILADKTAALIFK